MGRLFFCIAVTEFVFAKRKKYELKISYFCKISLLTDFSFKKPIRM